MRLLFTWHRAGAKPLFEPMATKFTDIYVPGFNQWSWQHNGRHLQCDGESKTTTQWHQMHYTYIDMSN